MNLPEGRGGVVNGEERRAVVLDHQRDLALALRGGLVFNARRAHI